MAFKQSAIPLLLKALHPSNSPEGGGVVSLWPRLLQSIKKKASFLEVRGPGQLNGESLAQSWAAQVALKWR